MNDGDFSNISRITDAACLSKPANVLRARSLGSNIKRGHEDILTKSPNANQPHSLASEAVTSPALPGTAQVRPETVVTL